MREFTHLQVYTELGVGRGAEVCVCERACALLSRWCEALHIHVHIPSILSLMSVQQKSVTKGEKSSVCTEKAVDFCGYIDCWFKTQFRKYF